MATHISSPETIRVAEEILNKFTEWGEDWVLDLRSTPVLSPIHGAIKVGKLDAIDFAERNLARVVKEVLGLEP